MTPPDQPDPSPPARQAPSDTKAERLARIMIAVATCLGALGLAALVYFPLHYLQ